MQSATAVAYTVQRAYTTAERVLRYVSTNRHMLLLLLLLLLLCCCCICHCRCASPAKSAFSQAWQSHERDFGTSRVVVGFHTHPLPSPPRSLVHVYQVCCVRVGPASTILLMAHTTAAAVTLIPIIFRAVGVSVRVRIRLTRSELQPPYWGKPAWT